MVYHFGQGTNIKHQHFNIKWQAVDSSITGNTYVCDLVQPFQFLLGRQVSLVCTLTDVAGAIALLYWANLKSKLLEASPCNLDQQSVLCRIFTRTQLLMFHNLLNIDIYRKDMTEWAGRIYFALNSCFLHRKLSYKSEAFGSMTYWSHVVVGNHRELLTHDECSWSGTINVWLGNQSGQFCGKDRLHLN